MSPLILFLLLITVAYTCSPFKKMACSFAYVGCESTCDGCNIPECDCCTACLACVTETVERCCQCLFPQWVGCLNNVTKN